jgi:hypothetical protein
VVQISLSLEDDDCIEAVRIATGRLISMRGFKPALMPVVVSACLPLTCVADVDWGLNPNLNDTIFIGLGALYVAKSSSSAQLNSDKAAVRSVDFQNALGMKDTGWGPDAAFRWRMSEHWRLEVSYLWTSRSGSKSIDQDIQWSDVVYPVNTQVSSKVSFSDLRTSVGYSLYKTSDKELGVGVGLHVLGWEASLSTPTHATAKDNVLAPLPILSVYGAFALDERWSVGARLDQFSLTYQQYHGGITVLGLNLQYQPFRHIGFALGYTALFLNFSATSSGLGSFQGKLNQNLQGPSFYVTASF